jgi:hypothetical protein
VLPIEDRSAGVQHSRARYRRYNSFGKLSRGLLENIT